jgi:hypothetical protein
VLDYYPDGFHGDHSDVRAAVVPFSHDMFFPPEDRGQIDACIPSR